MTTAQPAPVPAPANDVLATTGSAPRMPTLDDLRLLAARTAEVTVSLYLPVDRSGAGREADRIRLRNLIHHAARQLDTAADAATALAITARLEDLAAQPALWAHPGDGMALFASAAWAHAFHLPLKVADFATVGSHCHLKPLASLLQCDGRFHLLELSQHGVRLHECSHFGMHEIALPGAPQALEEVCPPVAGEHRVEVRTLHGGPSSPHYFAVTGDEQAKERIRNYFRRIDACVCALHDSRTPLLIAGVGFLLPLYRSVNHHPLLMEEGIDIGNPQHAQDRRLHEDAWRIMAPYFARTAVAARERLADSQGTGRTSAELAAILPAAREGRVADLFVAADRVRWGTFDERDGRIREHDPRWVDDDDLLNLALIHALATRANIHVLPRTQLPGGCDVQALFRY